MQFNAEDGNEYRFITNVHHPKADVIAELYHCRALQAAVADRVVLQVDQAELEGEDVPGDFRERCADSTLDRNVRLSAARMAEVQIKAWAVSAADVAIITTEFVRTAESGTPISTTSNYAKPTAGAALKAMGQQCGVT